MKENMQEFYVKNFYYLNNLDNIELSFVPHILTRRMSTLDKMTVYVLNRAFCDDIENIVYSSQYGEVERLLKIISQYSENNEVSPNTFSSSVHNFPVGFFLLNKRFSVPYNAVSATQNSISSGFLSALISDYKNILYCYCDSNKGETNSLALVISKEKQKGLDKYKITFKSNEKADDFKEYTKLFNRETNCLETAFFKLERLSYD